MITEQFNCFTSLIVTNNNKMWLHMLNKLFINYYKRSFKQDLRTTTLFMKQEHEAMQMQKIHYMQKLKEDYLKILTYSHVFEQNMFVLICSLLMTSPNI